MVQRFAIGDFFRNGGYASWGSRCAKQKIYHLNQDQASKKDAMDHITDDTKQVCQFDGTPSAELCSERIFPTRLTWGLISNSLGTVKKASSVLVKQHAKQVLFFVPPTPPSGCQAQGFSIRTTNKINNRK
jgi:hypothetical protein